MSSIASRYSLRFYIATMWRHLSHGSFFMSWWAMPFPTDGWVAAALGYYRARPEILTALVAIAALATATTLIGIIGLRTTRSMLSGAAFRED